MPPCNVYAGIFADERGQYLLRAVMHLSRRCIGSMRSERSYQKALSLVHLWKNAVFVGEIDAAISTFPKLPEIYRLKFAEYVGAVRPGRTRPLRVVAPLLLPFVRTLVQRMCTADVVRDGSYFSPANVLMAQAHCMEWIRATFDEFESSTDCARIVDEPDDIEPSDSVSNAPDSPRREGSITIDLG